jgi:ribosomal protein L37AE/L43A
MDDTRAETHPCPFCGHPMVESRAGAGQWFCTLNKRAVVERRSVRGHVNGNLTVWTEARFDAWHSPV